VPNILHGTGGLFEILFPVMFATVLWRRTFLRDPRLAARILCDLMS